MYRLVRPGFWVALCAIAYAADAASTDTLQTVVVTATRTPQPSFDLPVSITRIGNEVLQQARQEVNLSESLARVPGLLAQNRQNYAQDLQISIRGFGARSTFGVRGVRLYADGIPATLPDGQGQVSHFDLGSAGHLEVLRGPFSALYGNSSGGVIALFTEEAAAGFNLTATATQASHATQRAALKAAGEVRSLNYVINASRFDSDGYRDHSAAQRDNANARLRWNYSDTAQLTVIANAMQLDADDPLGLTSAQLDQPRQAGSNALAFNTRKRVEQQQLGLQHQWQWSDADTLSSMLYGGQRSTLQFQAIPVATQAPATQSGGVIDLDRDYWGGDVHWTRTREIAQVPVQFTLGLSRDQLDEVRRGYQNFIGSQLGPQLGVRGALRRNEANTTANFDQYVQAQWQPGDQWLLLLGARHSRVRFTSQDRYVVAGNGDDSGKRSYRATTPVAGLTFKVTDYLHFYGAYGQGFETPTFNELAYRSVNGTQTGLNLNLAAARSSHFELGMKARAANTTFNASVFHSKTENELAVLANAGGRSVFQNVGRTGREGVELEFTHQWRNLSTAWSYTWLQARYAQAFTTCITLPCVGSVVPADARMPGIPEHSAYAELAWQPLRGVSVAVEGRYVGELYADDLQSARVPGQVVTSMSLSLEQTGSRWQVQEYLRVDNLADASYIGSVIVNESNQRYFEPAPRRTWLLGVKVALRSAH